MTNIEAMTRAGRTIGILILIQMVGSTVVNFVLEGPVFDAPGFLVMPLRTHSRSAWLYFSGYL